MMRFYCLIILCILYIFNVEDLYAEEYFAFSLREARNRIIKASPGDVPPEVFNLGGITAIKGLVYDKQTGDVILVGEISSKRSILTLDDFVVALKARFIYGKWPLVSIDPTNETKKNQMQIIRFEGGIQDTQFGEDLFDADYRLKKMGMGLLMPGIPGLKTYWDLGIERLQESEGESYEVNSRFWFYPVLPSVSVREDVVAIKGLKVGVFTEVLSAALNGEKIEDLSTFKYEVGERFAHEVSDNFDSLASVHPSFLRLQGLDELVALTKAIEEMDQRPDLSFYLHNYQIKEVKTKKVVEVLKRVYEYELSKTHLSSRGYYWEVSGGVELMAIALRLKAGDVTALKEAVLKTRPKTDALSWGFSVGEWIIPFSTFETDMSSAAALYAHGEFLFRSGDYDRAIACWLQAARAYPEVGDIYFKIGMAFERKGMSACAADYYTKALQLSPFLKNYQEKVNTINQ